MRDVAALAAHTDLADAPADTHAYAIAGAAPIRVEHPTSPEAVAAALAAAREASEAVVPWGAGTKQQWGNPPRRYDVAVDLTALDQVLEYEPADLVVTAQPGVPLRALQERLGASGQFLALDPPYGAHATVGGTLAANASGPSRLLYGTARDLVLGMRVANAAGQIVKSGGKVVKNVVGYDLHKLHVGGLGTLGAIVEVTFKVHPRPKAEATVVAAFASLEAAAAAAGSLVRSQLNPRAVDLVRTPLPSIPSLSSSAGDWQVLMWAAGSPATVDRQAGDAAALCRDGGATRVERLEGDDHAAVWERVREVGRRRAGEPASATAALVKLTGLPNTLAALIRSVESAVSPLDVQPSFVARAGNGVLYAALSAPDAVRLQAALLTLVGLATARSGSAVIEEAPDAVRAAIDVWGPTRDDFPLMQRIKAEFDPTGTLNPGRFVGRI
jgi:glycolate oxidase FAD binding subunit